MEIILNSVTANVICIKGNQLYCFCTCLLTWNVHLFQNEKTSHTARPPLGLLSVLRGHLPVCGRLSPGPAGGQQNEHLCGRLVSGSSAEGWFLPERTTFSQGSGVDHRRSKGRLYPIWSGERGTQTLWKQAAGVGWDGISTFHSCQAVHLSGRSAHHNHAED